MELKAIIQERGLDVVNRDINNRALIELGLTRKLRTEIILGLSAADYCKGPEEDRDRPGEVWVFGAHVDENEIYIKLKIAEIGLTKIAKCISFHKAQAQLYYPLRIDPR